VAIAKYCLDITTEMRYGCYAIAKSQLAGRMSLATNIRIRGEILAIILKEIVKTT